MKRICIALIPLAFLLSACDAQGSGSNHATDSLTFTVSEDGDAAAVTSTDIVTVTSTGIVTVTSTGTTAVTTVPTVTSATAATVVTRPDNVSFDEVFGWFEEVCLDAEFSYDGDPSCVQKWTDPLIYTVNGTPTEADAQTLERVCNLFNSIEGFPGIAETADEQTANLAIWFCDADELVQQLGDPFSSEYYGGTRFWYDGDNRIYQGIICCRNDISQEERDAVIAEELYNILGPIQDTQTRTDSVIYQYSNENTQLSQVDLLILQLLYHPDIRCGMGAADCERVIRGLMAE